MQYIYTNSLLNLKLLKKGKNMEMDAAKLIGAGLAVIALAGVGVGIGNIFASLVTAVGRNPAAKNEVFGIAILGFALTEAVALFALVIALLLLFTF
jgi:F0F1-type ATP synthase membrane subunit c/vacuolar-type H+-ATPase subunit K